MKAPILGRPGLSETEFNELLDTYLLNNTIEVDKFEALNRDQENIIIAVKRSLGRIRRKLRQDI